MHRNELNQLPLHPLHVNVNMFLLLDDEDSISQGQIHHHHRINEKMGFKTMLNVTFTSFPWFNAMK